MGRAFANKYYCWYRDEVIKVLERHELVEVELLEFALDLLVLDRELLRFDVVVEVKIQPVVVVDMAAACCRGRLGREVVCLGAIL